LNLIKSDIFSDEKDNDPILKGDKKVSNSFLKSLGNLVKFKQHLNIANMLNQNSLTQTQAQDIHNMYYYNQIQMKNKNNGNYYNNTNTNKNTNNNYNYNYIKRNIDTIPEKEYDNTDDNNDQENERYFEDYYTNDSYLPTTPNLDTNKYKFDSKIIPKKQKSFMQKKLISHLTKRTLLPVPFPFKADIKNSYLVSNINNNPKLIKKFNLNDQIKIEGKNEIQDMIRIMKNNNSDVYKKLINKYGF
jgi:hypothetical protein